MRGRITYYKELQNTYIVEEDCRKEIIESFTGQMILKGKIKSIAACSLQFIDGRREIKFDVSSLKTLEQSFAVREIDYQTLSGILIQIAALMEDMENNLAESNGICFAPDYLYMDTSSNKLSFLYDYTESHEKSKIIDLAEYCLERVNNKEDRAVDLAYYFYEHTRGENFSLREIEEYLERQNSIGKSNIKTENTSDDNSESYKEIINISDTDRVVCNDSSNIRYKKDEVLYEIPGMRETPVWEDVCNNTEDDRDIFMDETKVKKKAYQNMKIKTGKIKNSKAFLTTGIVLIASSLVSFAAFIITSIYYVLVPVLEMVWIGASLIMAIGGAVLLVIKRLDDNKDSEEAEDYIDDVDPEFYENGVYNRKRTVNPEEEAIWEDVLEMQEKKEIYNKTGDPIKGTNENSYDGKTVYIGKDETEKEHCLIGRHKGREREYPISSFPWIIGKESSRVNMLVKEASVSRIHARLINEDGSIFLEDLASTNGTCVNDLPLAPRERMKLKRGDSVSFGRSEFVFE